jgi:hypothetical protein
MEKQHSSHVPITSRHRDPQVAASERGDTVVPHTHWQYCRGAKPEVPYLCASLAWTHGEPGWASANRGILGTETPSMWAQRSRRGQENDSAARHNRKYHSTAVQCSGVGDAFCASRQKSLAT